MFIGDRFRFHRKADHRILNLSFDEVSTMLTASIYHEKVFQIRRFHHRSERSCLNYFQLQITKYPYCKPRMSFASTKSAYSTGNHKLVNCHVTKPIGTDQCHHQECNFVTAANCSDIKTDFLNSLIEVTMSLTALCHDDMNFLVIIRFVHVNRVKAHEINNNLSSPISMTKSNHGLEHHFDSPSQRRVTKDRSEP